MIAEKGIWIPVEGNKAEIMPNKDGEVCVTRCGMGKVWVQKIDYYKGEKRFHWDGLKAWMPLQEEKPKPYRFLCANPWILEWEE